MIDQAQRATARLPLRGDRRGDRRALVARRRAPRRRALLPSLAGAFALLCFAALLVNDLVAGHALAGAAVARGLLARRRAGRVPRRPAALAARARRPRRPVPRARRDARRASCSAALRATLGDPELVVAYCAAGVRRVRRRRRRAGRAARRRRRRAVVPSSATAASVAALVYDASLDDDPELVEAVTRGGRDRDRERAPARRVAGAARRAQGVARADRRGGRRRAAPARAQPARRRAAAPRRDRAAAAAAPEPRRRRPVDAEQLVTTASDELAHSLAELRELARGIHPAVLEHGLAAALDVARRRAPRSRRRSSCEPAERLPEPVELAAYFVASEALANVAKYAQATHATIRVWRARLAATIEIADDGVGGADDTRGSGLRGLADRVEALDGRLRVRSPPGAGTTVTAELPCGS